MRFRPAIWLVAIAVACIDQAAKAWAIHSLSDGEQIPVMGNFITLQLRYNGGAALSLFGDHTWLVSIVMILIALVLIAIHGRARGWWGLVVFGAALGGAFGNIGDRLFRGPGWGRGSVVDMINYNGAFVGNVADIAIVGAAAVTIIASWAGIAILNPRRRSEAEPVEAAEPSRGASAT